MSIFVFYELIWICRVPTLFCSSENKPRVVTDTASYKIFVGFGTKLKSMTKTEIKRADDLTPDRNCHNSQNNIISKCTLSIEFRTCIQNDMSISERIITVTLGVRTQDSRRKMLLLCQLRQKVRHLNTAKLGAICCTFVILSRVLKAGLGVCAKGKYGVEIL